MAYRFRLETVLRVRRIQEERARAELLAARTAEHAATTEHDRRGAVLDAARAAGLPDGSRLQWTAARDHHERLASAVEAARAAEVAAADLTSRSLAHWESAAADLKGLERLDERHRAEWRAEQERTEQKRLDEGAAARARDRRRTTDDGGRP
ncbi:flagellar export protein FliJ [Dermatobacter hominis]|uniref:flagellar export protein FliJ n=1 Tax=Dermatobacter hominis TaxID=2884263 RepID=UPI001D1023C3|nr:flagellar FliJ family protein [Dermatobacter hominis]UDY37183.1 flagellar FliJ family protein [Dermatobacter hominis]